MSISKEQKLDMQSHHSAMSEMKPSKRARAWFDRKPYSIKGSDNSATNRKSHDGK